MPRTIAFRIAEMDCADEVRQLKDVLLPLVGEEQRLFFDLMRARLTIQAPEGVSDQELQQAIRSTGMSAEPWGDGPAVEPEGWWSRHGRSTLTYTGAVLILLGFFVHASATGVLQALTTETSTPLLAKVLYLLAAISGGWYILPRALFSLRRGSPDMNLLMTLAVIGAMILGAWLEAASVAVLFTISLLLESWSINRARRAVASLLDLTPETARLVLADGGAEEVPVREVRVGQVVRVRPGDRLPLDGIILNGITSLNQAPITGESMPIEAQVGDLAYAGSINGEGLIDIQVTHPVDQTTLARIIRLVEEARSRRAPSERWVERFARVYTPAMFLLAALVAVMGPLLLGGLWGEWAYRALVVLVIACPCALVISTPVSVVAGMTAASRNGVLIKGGVYLESPATLKAIAFDKTGTLTHGEPLVKEFLALESGDAEELLGIAAALERESTHPLARAIVEYAKERKAEPAQLESLRNHTGLGFEGRVEGTIWRIGRERFLVENGVVLEGVHSHLEQIEQDGGTVVLLARDTTPVALFALKDRVRREAKNAIAGLRAAKIEHLVMLTGDQGGVARSIGYEIGITDIRAGLLPEEKLDVVGELVRLHGHVAMVGDGINDAPALAAASLGIAMGVGATDAALETADIALLGDDLSRLPWLVHHSRRSLAIIRANIGFALGIKAVFLVLAALNLATLWMAIAADMGASLAVTFNALRLLRTKG